MQWFRKFSLLKNTILMKSWTVFWRFKNQIPFHIRGMWSIHWKRRWTLNLRSLWFSRLKRNCCFPFLFVFNGMDVCSEIWKIAWERLKTKRAIPIVTKEGIFSLSPCMHSGNFGGRTTICDKIEYNINFHCNKQWIEEQWLHMNWTPMLNIFHFSKVQLKI